MAKPGKKVMETRNGFHDLMDTVHQMEASRNIASAAPLQNSASNGDQPIKKTEPQAAPIKKPSLRDLLKQTTNDTDVQQVSEDLEQSQFTPAEIKDYVLQRWKINRLPGMGDGWAARSWEDQLRVLEVEARKSSGIHKMISMVNALHGNVFLRQTLADVMKDFGAPLQGVQNMVQFKAFLNRAVQEGLVEVVENPKVRTDEGIFILEDLADATNLNTVAYLPRKGSKVARDSWLVVREKYSQIQEAWKPFEKLRQAATLGLTPFKVSDSRDGKRRGMNGNLFVMATTGNWAVLLNACDETSSDRKVVSIVQHVGLEEKDIPSPNSIGWNHKSHSLHGAQRADLWLQINSALEELNNRQRTRAVADKEKSNKAFDLIKKMASMPSEPRHQGLHRILGGEEGVVTVCLPNLGIKNKFGNFKAGFFGAAFSCDNGILVLEAAAAAECLGFDKGLIGKKLPFGINSNDPKNMITIDVKAFCQQNGISRLTDDSFQSLKILANLVKRRLLREEALAPESSGDEEDYEDQSLDDETIVETEQQQ